MAFVLLIFSVWVPPVGLPVITMMNVFFTFLSFGKQTDDEKKFSYSVSGASVGIIVLFGYFVVMIKGIYFPLNISDYSIALLFGLGGLGTGCLANKQRAKIPYSIGGFFCGAAVLEIMVLLLMLKDDFGEIKLNGIEIMFEAVLIINIAALLIKNIKNYFTEKAENQLRKYYEINPDDDLYELVPYAKDEIGMIVKNKKENVILIAFASVIAEYVLLMYL